MNILKLKATENWDAGAPIGNGKIGSLVYGSNLLKVTVDRIDLWDLRPNEVTLEGGFNFANLVRLSRSKKTEDKKERTRLFEDIFMGKPYPSKITAGRIELNFEPALKDVAYVLDMSKAVVKVYDGNELVAEIFTDYVSLIGVIRLYRSADISFHIPTYLSGDCSREKSEVEGLTLGYPNAEIKKNGSYKWYEQRTHTDYSFGTVTKKVDNVIYYTLATTDDDADYISVAKQALSAAARIGFEELFSEHISSWRKYWAKSFVNSGDRLLDATYKKSNYLLRCCSRKGFYPMPLQGVWTADNDKLPPWKGDYHYDTNVELSYSSYLKANRLEEGEVLLDYIWNNRAVFKKFTHNFYGVEGMLVPACSTIDGQPMGGWAHYSLSPIMTIWVIRCFDEYYLYTGDKVFLKNKAFPIFSDVGKAIYGLLEEKDGKIFLPLSSSPEIFDDTDKAYLEPNSSFDLALLIYLYKTLKRYSDELGYDDRLYKEILSKLDNIAIDDDNVVMLDKTQRLPYSHRHFSHVMCIHPLRLFNYDNPEHKKIIDASILNLEQLGTGWWVGFSFTMSANLYAVAYKGNAAYQKLREFSTGFLSENGFHLNGDFKNYGFTQWHYKPFTLEASFGFCDALQETLLQEQNGYIHFFPAVADDIQQASFKKFRSYGGILVDGKYNLGITENAKIYTKKSITVRIKNTFGTARICINNSCGKQLIECKKGNIFEITLEKGTNEIYGIEE